MPTAFCERLVIPNPKKEITSDPSSLKERIEHLRRNWQMEGLPPNWDEFPGAGFQVAKQVNLIYSELDESDSPRERQAKLLKGLERTELDIKGFILEYLAGGLVFPIRYRKEWVDGQPRIKDPLYDKLMVDTASEEERNGVVKKTLAQKVEPFLLSAPDGAIAVMTSPVGWTGMKGSDSKTIEYESSQTYIWQKRGEEFLGFTIKSDFIEKEHRELLFRLDGRVLSPQASVSNYVEAIAFLTPQDKEDGIREVVDIMRDVRFDLSGGSLYAYKDKLWREVYRDLDRREELWQFDEKTKAIVKEFDGYVLNNNLSKKEIREALTVTLLRLSNFIMGGKRQETREGQVYWQEAPESIHYARVYSEVRQIGGCAGGGGSKSVVVNSITPRNGLENSTTSDGKKTLECTCPNCNQKVKAIIEGGRILCPNCNASAPYEC